jgi:hypothetical protein
VQQGAAKAEGCPGAVPGSWARKRSPGRPQQARLPARAPKREWESVAVAEDAEVKVKRVRQVMQVRRKLVHLMGEPDFAHSPPSSGILILQ